MNASTFSWRRARTALLTGVAAAALLVAGQQAVAAPDPTPPTTMDEAFTQAAEEFQVPRALLVAVGYGESRLDNHDGEPSAANGYGVMHLVSNPERHTLEQAAKLTGESRTALRTDDAANIRGGAAVLRAYADRLGLDAADRADLGAWYPVVARYSGASSDQLARLYADTVYDILAEGVDTRVDGGGKVTVPPRDVTPERGRYAAVQPLDGEPGEATPKSDDYPPAHWVPASTANYSAGRSSAITAVVIHVTQGSYAGTISWFQNPEAQVSAHYVIRSSDGDVTQMVRDGDTAWHARSGNAYSIGIEHEGYVDDPAWFTDAMYNASAALTRHLCDTYGIPKDRSHILGHHEVPGNDHTDPGPNWDWDRYMALVNS